MDKATKNLYSALERVVARHGVVRDHAAGHRGAARPTAPTTRGKPLQNGVSLVADVDGHTRVAVGRGGVHP